MMFRSECVTSNQWKHKEKILYKYHEYYNIVGLTPFVRQKDINKITVAEFEIIIQTLEEKYNIKIN